MSNGSAYDFRKRLEKRLEKCVFADFLSLTFLIEFSIIFLTQKVRNR